MNENTRNITKRQSISKKGGSHPLLRDTLCLIAHRRDGEMHLLRVRLGT